MIILFNGPPGAGKDLAAQYFSWDKGFKHLSFKYKLYEETVKYFDCDWAWFMDGYHNREIKEMPTSLLGGFSRREAMIYVSEKIIKPKKGLDYFGSQVAEEIEEGKNYCISDGGFIDELVPVINKVGSDNFVLVQLTRDGCDYSSDSRRYFDGNVVWTYINQHETPIENKYILPHKFDVRTYRVHNNGTIEEFNRVMEDIYKRENKVEEYAT